MRLKKLFCGLFAVLLLISCTAEEETFVPRPVIPDGWQTYSLQIDNRTDFRTGETSEDPLSLEIALPPGWYWYENPKCILDAENELRGGYNYQWYSGYSGDLNCNDFYMMLELDGHVIENGVDGSRRRIELPNGNVWRQGIYEDDHTVWEYYFWVGEGHVRFFFYAAPDEMPDEEIILGILGSITPAE